MSTLLKIELIILGVMALMFCALIIYNKYFNPVCRRKPDSKSKQNIECSSIPIHFDKGHKELWEDYIN